MDYLSKFNHINTLFQELDIIISIKNKKYDFVRHPVTNSELGESVDDLTYSYGEESFIGHDHVILNSESSYEKLSLSYALAQSAKVWVLEDRLDQTIARYSSLYGNFS